MTPSCPHCGGATYPSATTKCPEALRCTSCKTTFTSGQAPPAPPPARPWACPCCGGETAGTGIGGRACAAGCCFAASRGAAVPWLQSAWWNDAGSLRERSDGPASNRCSKHRPKCEADPGVSRRTGEASGGRAANPGDPAPSQHAGMLDAPKAPPPMCAYCDVPHPATDSCATRARIQRFWIQREYPMRDWGQRGNPWRPFDGIVTADQIAGRPDHRGSQRPCDACGLRACPHPRAKAGW